MTKTKHNDAGGKKIMLISYTLLTLAFFILRFFSGADNSDGYYHIIYTVSYLITAFIQHILVLICVLSFLPKAENSDKFNERILPLILISGLGMMRSDAPVLTEYENADKTPAFMILILLMTLTVQSLSKITLTGAAGIIAGTLYSPYFGLAFSPFIFAAVFLLEDKNPLLKKISAAVNGSLCIASAVYSVTGRTGSDLSFHKEYIPVLLLVITLTGFFIYKKDHSLIPLAVLPIFPLFSHIFTGAFPTELFTLSASIAPTVLLFGTAVIGGSSLKLKEYAKKILCNDFLYLAVILFILFTVNILFTAPGSFRETYSITTLT